MPDLKTTYAVNSDRLQMRIHITTALRTAIASELSLATNETLDISLVFRDLGGGEESREREDTFVTGSSTPITDVSGSRTRANMTFALLYTNNKETVGTDNVDPYELLQAIFRSNAPFKFDYSVNGGNTGDERLTSDEDCYITNFPPPVGGVSSTGKTQVTMSVYVGELTPSTVV